MANRAQQDCYSNPAFCMQSEGYRWKSSPSKKQTPRQSPVGANVSLLCEEKPVPGPKPKKYVQEDYDEQDFYEEMLVDGNGVVKCKKLVVVTSPNHQQLGVSGSRYADVQDNHRRTHRYEEIPDERYEDIESNGNVVFIQENSNHPRNRYEYIPIPQNEIRSVPSSPKRIQHKPQEIDTSALKEGYALVRRNDRYEMLPLEKISDTYRYNCFTQRHRYEYINDSRSSSHSPPQEQRSRYEYPNEQQNRHLTMSPQTMRRAGNPIATQKLHELLSTPKKSARPPMNSSTPQKPMSPHTPKKIITPAASPVQRNPFVTPTKQPQTPRAQQKLNYALATRQIAQDKRHTAIIAPICSSPIQSVYSETTFSNKSESWMNLSLSKAPVQATLAVAAVMMALCGGVTSGLCFYMVWIMGRLYYLDFGIVAGFTCLLLGLLGFRSRNCRWLPNRNYISGYIVLSVFSLLTCAGLLILLFKQPKPGSPLADMTSGAVCGISVLSLVLASVGVVSSYCCKYPPPDNRVEHCARGFTV